MGKLTFSGHESFQCRQLWLKKGYDFIEAGGKFADEDAVVGLGVGKNMVGSIRFWLRSFNLVDENDQTNALANFVFGGNGVDPFLEDTATIWLLHYHLVTANRATLYNLFFNKFRKERIEFHKGQLLNFLNRFCDDNGFSVSDQSLNRDIDIFLRSYVRPKKSDRQNVEDDFSTLLIDLGLVHQLERDHTEGKTWYKVESDERLEIPIQLLLYSILNQEPGLSISFNKLLNGENSIGVVYAFSPNGLVKKIREIADFYDFASYTEDAGIRELQFKKRPDKYKILLEYYEN